LVLYYCYSIVSIAGQSTGAPRRAYTSPHRDAQARATRDAILAVARHLFATQGYAATPREQIARAAGVAVQTVGGKHEVLLDVLRSAATGPDGEPLPVAMRSRLQDLRDLPDSVALLHSHARASAAVSAAAGDAADILRRAAHADPQLAALWDDFQRQRRRGQAAVVDLLTRRTPPIRPGLTSAEAADLLWTLTDDALHTSLVGERGWTLERFAAWLGEAMCALLLNR
jgi:AcrR family transcriptional regulator